MNNYTKTIGCIIIILTFLFFPIHTATGGKELTRDMAKDIIIKQTGETDFSYYNLPKDVELGVAYAKYYNIMETFKKDGLISITGGADRVTINLTPKGMEYLINKESVKNDNVYKIKICDEKFIEVTGIINESPTKALVEYNIKVLNPTPFAKIFNIKDGLTRMKVAEFLLYDDGWRIGKITRKPTQ